MLQNILPDVSLKGYVINKLRKLYVSYRWSQTRQTVDQTTGADKSDCQATQGSEAPVKTGERYVRQQKSRMLRTAGDYTFVSPLFTYLPICRADTLFSLYPSMTAVIWSSGTNKEKAFFCLTLYHSQAET